MNNIEKRMQELKPSGLSGSEKERVWSRVETQLSSPKNFSVLDGLPTFKTLRRVSVPLVVALGLILGGGATVYAHETALPGDMLFPVKIHVEKAQIFLAQNSAKKDELRIKFSEKRLNEVRTLLATSQAGASTTPAVTGTTTTSVGGASSTSTNVPSKKLVRAERAIAAALAELEETKANFVSSGSDVGVLIIDDIINELKGVGDGTVTITKIAMNGGKNHDKNLRVYATITSTSTGTTTGSTVTRVKLEEKKQGTKIEIKTNVTSGSGKGDDKKEDRGRGSKNDRDDDDEDEDNDDDNDSRKNDDDEDDDDEDDNDKKVRICHKAGESMQTIHISVRAARAHVSHGDTLGACNGGGVTPPAADTTAPVISSIAVNAAATTSTITWITSEQSTGELYLGTTSPVTTDRSPNAAHTTLMTAHSLTVSALLPSTTYYYVVVSKDASGNRATSSMASFVTPALPPAPDIAAPVLSGITATTVGGTTTIGFTTNESATGTVYVGTTNPLVIGTAVSVSSPIASTSHSTIFSGLATSTTHYYVVAARDLSGNTATSSQGSFLTN